MDQRLSAAIPFGTRPTSINENGKNFSLWATFLTAGELGIYTCSMLRKLLTYPTINRPPVRLHQHNRSKVLLWVPPVGGARCTAAEVRYCHGERAERCNNQTTVN